jgi:hypothetical protein
MALVQQLTELTVESSPALPSEDLATALWSWIQVEEHPSGLLRFSLAAPGVLLWLQYWNQQPAEELAAALAQEVISVNINQVSSSTARRLQLHPTVLIQYLYARCYQLRQVNCRDHLGPGAAKSPSLETEPLQREEIHFNQADWPVLQRLIHLVDHLETTSLKPEGLWKLALDLAEATDIWLGEWSTTSFACPNQWMILSGIEQALFCFMKHKLGLPLPKGL